MLPLLDGLKFKRTVIYKIDKKAESHKKYRLSNAWLGLVRVFHPTGEFLIYLFE